MSLGHLAEFRPGQDRLSIYLEQFEMYVKANGVQAGTKVPLPDLIGPIVYSILHDMLAPDCPTKSQ